jgi:hypothetical protein
MGVLASIMRSPRLLAQHIKETGLEWAMVSLAAHRFPEAYTQQQLDEVAERFEDALAEGAPWLWELLPPQAKQARSKRPAKKR